MTNEIHFYLLFQKANEINEKLLKNINDDARIHLVPSKSKGVYFLRFAVCAAKTESSDITYAWNVICELTEKLLKE